MWFIGKVGAWYVCRVLETWFQEGGIPCLQHSRDEICFLLRMIGLNDDDVRHDEHNLHPKDPNSDTAKYKFGSYLTITYFASISQSLALSTASSGLSSLVHKIQVSRNAGNRSLRLTS